MIDILLNTPLYVYWMFISLLIVGLMQKKTRNVTKTRALSIPIILILLSIGGFFVDFEVNIIGILFCTLGFLFSSSLILFLNKKYNIFVSIIYSFSKKQFIIKGSYIPLTLFMLVFFVKYFVGLIKATNLELFNDIFFILFFSFTYGLFIGIFFMRLYVLLEKSKKIIS